MYHYRENVKHSASRFWPVCHLVDQLQVHEALKQLDHTTRKGAVVLAEVSPPLTLALTPT